MRKLSIFASTHFLIARFLIAIIHIALIGMAMKLATLLDSIQFFLSPTLFVASLLLFVIAVNVFRKHRDYYSKRLRYFICGATLFVAMSCFYSNNAIVRHNVYTEVGGTIVNPVEKTLSKAQQRKQFRQVFKELRKEIKAGKGDAGKTLAIIGVVFGGLFLLVLLAALSCSIACNGSGALATLVAIAGGFGIIWLVIWAIKKINNKKPVPEVKQQVD